eukprot:3162823-Ditylum_brightwellii.AAC.1
MLAKGATQLNAANDVGTKTKALLIKLLTVHGKDNINVFAEMKQRLLCPSPTSQPPHPGPQY